MKITETEFRQLLRVHDTDVNVPERPAYRLLQDSAERYPDRTALIATERTLSYKELNEEANAVGHVLFSKGVRPDTIVAVLAERDSRAYVMRQGVLKSGGAFLPIDPDYPGDRIHFILEDSGANILLITTAVAERRKEFFDRLAHEGKEIVIVQDAVSEGEKTDLNLAVPYEALAYVIYTSGSTGRPKG